MQNPLDTLRKIRQAVENRPAELETLKAAGAKVVGWINYNVPEELILALDLIPVRLGRGGDDHLVEHGSRWISTKNCVYVREIVGLFAENEDPYVRAADLVAVDATCLQVFRTGEVIRHYFGKEVAILGVPRNFHTPEGAQYFRHELKHFAGKLEEFSGRKLTEEKLAASIALLRGIRSTLDEIYTWQAADNALITWEETLDVVQAGHFLDRTAYLELLHELVAELQEKQATDEIHDRFEEVRIFVSGSIIPPGDRKIIGILRSLGARIVGDDLWSGLAPQLNVDVKAPTVDAIADAYLARVPHGALPYLDLETDQRLANLKKLLHRFHAHAVVYHTLRYCDPYTFKGNETKQVLQAEGFPFLELHTEYAGSDYEAVRTRAEAFVELVRNRNLIEA
jgi:benzoyl-CoA reductase/2-hydroxyglutaryl-CoA dehydratase subunit BcrC/BadD/HgdB